MILPYSAVYKCCIRSGLWDHMQRSDSCSPLRLYPMPSNFRGKQDEIGLRSVRGIEQLGKG